MRDLGVGIDILTAGTMTEELKDQIRKLTEVHGGMQRVRQIPPGILQSFQKRNDVWEEFTVLKRIGETVSSEGVQAALERAQESMKADDGDLGTDGRRESRKRSRQIRPGTPDLKGTFTLKETKEKGVKMSDIGDWAHEYNKMNKNKIRIRGKLVRYTIPDVMTVYMGIGGDGDEDVVVETIRVFGPREQKGCHEQSNYGVYQQVTQQLGRILSKRTFDGIIELLSSYEGLFISQCVVCGRVVSGEGHVPPVVRWWTGQEWSARHVGCVIGGAIG